MKYVGGNRQREPRGAAASAVRGWKRGRGPEQISPLQSNDGKQAAFRTINTLHQRVSTLNKERKLFNTSKGDARPINTLSLKLSFKRNGLQREAGQPAG